MKLVNLQKCFPMTLSLYEFKEYEKKIKFNIFKVMKLKFNIIFSQLFLRSTFDDRF